MADAFQKKFDIPITLVCVGTPPESDYGREVQELLNKSENRIIMFPTQNYLNLAQFYQMADLSVFPKQCSMSFYDAQACGLPVVSENNNINLDRCGYHNGINFESGSVNSFREKILQFANMSKEERNKYSRNARNFIESGYDYANIAQQYTNYLQKARVNFR